jgi:hypothetical protein
MKAFTGWAITAGLVFAATAANAQNAAQQAGSARYQATSDIAAPYAEAPPPPPSAPAYGPPPRVIYGSPEYENSYGYGGYGPAVLPPREVYAVLRENGFSPLGAPRLRGLFYSIAAIDRRGDDGRLVIDARDGRIVRFVPADHFGRYDGYGAGYYGAPPPRPSYGPLEPMTRLDGAPPPARMASRTPSSVPLPRAAPSRPAGDQPVAATPTPAPPQQSVAMQAKPAGTPPPAAAAPAVVAPAAPVIQPTQPMPKVQDLE